MYAETSRTEIASGYSEDVRILRFPDVVKKTGMSKSDIYGRIRRNDFPEPVQIGPRSVGFVEREVNGWLHGLVLKNRKAA
jgi:prophage regulatory protein